jgi:signal transduction histidine kinase
MLDLQHNIVNILYTIKGVSESHLALVEEGRFLELETRVVHAEEALKKVARRALEAQQVTRRLGLALKSDAKAGRKASLQDAWCKNYELIKREFDLKGIEFSCQVPKDFPLLECEPSELLEVLYNLTKNALHAMGLKENADTLEPRVNGKFILRAEISLGINEEELGVIAVSDTGGGISRDKLARLFQPFFTTKGPEQGNGLGLYMIREIVRKNHGKINVSSFEGNGTTFMIQLPVAPKDVKGPVVDESDKQVISK